MDVRYLQENIEENIVIMLRVYRERDLYPRRRAKDDWYIARKAYVRLYLSVRKRNVLVVHLRFENVREEIADASETLCSCAVRVSLEYGRPLERDSRKSTAPGAASVQIQSTT